MVAIDIPDFSPEQIANSGQCFRMNRLQGENIWRVVALGKALKIQQTGENSFIFHCPAEEYRSVWEDYFDLRRNYGKIKKFILATGDPFLEKAVAYGSGLRILKQDLWEVMVSFIISQRNSISRIKNTVEKLCAPHGNAFPSPPILARYGEKFFRNIGLGYRAKYLVAIARAVNCGEFDMEHLKKLDCKGAVEYAKRFCGIGEKVANCIALYGLHEMDAFPRDTWINRTIEEQYGSHFAAEKFSPYAGLVQQYMFFYRRRWTE